MTEFQEAAEKGEISGVEQMIFVTVGTHEQQFDRLIKEVDRLLANKDITDEVIAQIGFGAYEPLNCMWKRLFPYGKIREYVEEARIVITHGGPSSFLAPLQIGKMPIVVPRQKRFGEHVNDHQLQFCRAVDKRLQNIILVEDIGKLQKAIMNYDSIAVDWNMKQHSNNTRFLAEFNLSVEEMMRGKED